MIQPQALIKLFGYNATLVNRQVEGMTHEESLLQPPFEGNCLNWTLGHLISARTRALETVGETPVWTDIDRAHYRGGSLPITEDEPGVHRLERLVEDFNRSQDRLISGLSRATFEEMCQSSGVEQQTVGDSLAYFHFHEAHHIGQILMLAQMAGKKGVWLS